MTLAALTWALYGDHGDLDPTARLVLVVLGDHAGTEGIAWPSRQTMAAAAGCSHDTVERRLRELVDRGLIRRADPDECPHAWRSHRADRRPNAYVLTGTHTPATGTQPAYPSTATGTQTGATGTQNRPHGYAAVRTEPKEPNTKDARARASGPSRPDSTRPCDVCRHIHPPDAEHLRRRPELATAGAARARQALAERQQP